MLGNVFFLLQKFLQKELGAVVWSRLFTEAGFTPKMYLLEAAYPDDEAIGLLEAGARLSGRPLPELTEGFGFAIAPDLLGLFRSLVRPEWKTLDLLEHVEEMHQAMRNVNPLADPPVVQALRISETELQLTYTSKRRLCSLARGTVRGVAEHYGEQVEIVEHACMLRGYPFCTFQVVVARPTAPDQDHDPEATQPRTPPGGMAAGDAPGPGGVSSRSPARPPDVAPSVPGDVPSQLMHYRILRQLGAGGMGAVYLAEDAILGRQVAVKLILPALAVTAENRERFLREARAMATLSDDHIVPVYQVGYHGDRLFIVMPRLLGRTLEQHLAGPDRPTHAEVARLGREIAVGLAAAHEAGVVHRDVKPSNIWLEDPARRVKILDFGLARSDAGVDQLTQAGVMLGSPLYMSPEQAAGDPVDGRSDLFSLGAILYRMCSGRTPFQGDSIMAVLRSIVSDAPQPVAEIAPGIPPGLAEIVMQLLAKTPADRPTSAAAVAAALMS